MTTSKKQDTLKTEKATKAEKPAVQETVEPPVTAAEAHQMTTAAPPAAIKPKHTLALQRTVGNQTVQRMISQRTGPTPLIQRTPDTKRIYSEEANYTKTLELKQDLGYITLNEITLTSKGEYSVKLNKPADDADTEEKTSEVIDYGDKKVGIKKETKKLWEDSVTERYTGLQPQFVEGGELTTKGGKLMYEAALEGQTVSFAVEFALLDVEKTERGIDVDILKVSPKTKIHFIKDLPINDGKGALSVEEEISIGFTPNLSRIAEWVSTRFAAAAAAEAIFVGGSVAVVVGSLVGICITLADAKELGQIPDQVGQNIIAYAKGYNDAMHNKTGDGGGWYYYQGWADGNTQLVKTLASGIAPHSVIMEEAAKKEYFWEAVNTISPQLKEQALQEWAATHWFDMNMDGEKGYRHLGKTLNALNLNLLM